MAIYGAGSLWGEREMRGKFFKEKKFILGWNDENAKDLYEAIAGLKVGDILYLKSNQPGSREIRIKGIGVVIKSLMQSILDQEFKDLEIGEWEELFVSVDWRSKEEFKIVIPTDEGKLTNIRAATFYEEYLSYVQQQVLKHLFKART
jgi:hypothetical protein